MQAFLIDIENGIALKIILWFQSWRTDLVSDLFMPFNWMGSETFYMILLTLVYWVAHKNIGRRLMICFLFSAWFNAFAKEVFKRPRPFLVSDRVQPAFTSAAYGLPSGHTQGGTAVGLVLIRETKKHWATVLLVLYIFLMGISRMVHGVHFPQDVLLGWFLGLAIVLGFYALEQRTGRFFSQMQWGTMLIVTALAAAAVFGLTFLTRPTPAGVVGALTPGAVLVGVIPGLFLESRYIRFSVQGGFGKKCLRYAVGIITALVLKEGLKPMLALISDQSLPMEAAVRMIRYFVLGLWLSAGAPWLFTRMKLAERDE